MSVSAAHAAQGQKRASDPREPELQTVVSCLVGVGIECGVLWKSKCKHVTTQPSFYPLSLIFFFLIHFEPWLVVSEDAEAVDRKGSF